MKCECEAIFKTPCNSTLPVDSKVAYRGKALDVTSDCLYAALDTDKCSRDFEGVHLF